MAINITTLKPGDDGLSNAKDGSIYTDLSLDFSLKSTNSSRKQLFSDNTSTDLQIDQDYRAITNSLLNIFNTAPGEKILRPGFGADLRYYLFEPISEKTAQLIGEVIVKAIKLYEPRVTVDEVFIKAFPEQNEYQIDVYLMIPTLNNQKYTFEGTLTNQGVRTKQEKY